MKSRLFGNSKLNFFPLGLGTIWFGRPWPPKNTDYLFPTSSEISSHFEIALSHLPNDQCLLMIDTAAAYGDSEIIIGKLLKQNPNWRSKVFIATKWGEEFDLETGLSRIDHSEAHLEYSLNRSEQRLGKIDLLYIHKTNHEVIRDKNIMSILSNWKGQNRISLIGVSISDQHVFESAVYDDELKNIDVIQMPANVFWNCQEQVRAVHAQGKAIVLNSPIRNTKETTPQQAYAELLESKEASMILTGTRNHLLETISYFDI